MTTSEQIEQINNEIKKLENRLKSLNNTKNDLEIKLFYERRKMKFGQPFMYNGKKIMKVVNRNEYFMDGYYLTKKGEISEISISVYKSGNIQPIQSE